MYKTITNWTPAKTNILLSFPCTMQFSLCGTSSQNKQIQRKKKHYHKITTQFDTGKCWVLLPVPVCQCVPVTLLESSVWKWQEHAPQTHLLGCTGSISWLSISEMRQNSRMTALTYRSYFTPHIQFLKHTFTLWININVVYTVIPALTTTGIIWFLIF
jgi:hypothetical protein